MGGDDKTKIIVAFGALSLITFLVFFFEGKGFSVEMIYFRGSNCRIVDDMDIIVSELSTLFGDKLVVKTIDIDSVNETSQDKEEVVQLMTKYNVVGVPEIIINGKKYMKGFTKIELKEAICQRYIIRPEVCR